MARVACWRRRCTAETALELLLTGIAHESSDGTQPPDSTIEPAAVH